MSDLHYPADRRYHKDHLWALVENDGRIRVGITDFAQEQLDNVIFIELPKVGDRFKQGTSGAFLESVKATSDAIMPVSGRVAAINEELADEPELVNADPYGKGWLMLLEPDGPSDAEDGNLIGAGEYAAMLG